MIQKRVEERRRDAQHNSPAHQLCPLPAALRLRHPPDHLVEALNARVQERHIVGVQHLSQCTGAAEVHRYISRRIEGIRQRFRIDAALFHHAHELRQTGCLLRGHVQRLKPCQQLPRLAGRLLYRAGSVVEHRGVGTAQRLVHLPVFAVVFDLRQCLGIVFQKSLAVPGVQARRLQVAHRVPHKERGVVAGHEGLEQIVAGTDRLCQRVALRRIRRQSLQRIKQGIVHRQLPQLPVLKHRKGLFLCKCLSAHIVQRIRVEVAAVKLLRILDVPPYRRGIARFHIVLQNTLPEPVLAALAHHLHGLLT